MAKKASAAQAKRLAWLWSDGRSAHILHDGRYTSSTDLACAKRGWLAPTGHFDTYPNGARYEFYEVTTAGLHALGAYLLALQAQEAS